jgi:hypothetical protein
MFLVVAEFKHGHMMKIRKLQGTCNWGDQLQCEPRAESAVVTLLWVVLSSFYCLWFAAYLLMAHHRLKKRLYQRYRISNVLLQLQVRHTADTVP